MNFDARDLIEANMALLQEAASRPEPDPAVLVCLATWGRGADPTLLQALQPYRVGLGFNGSVVARVPRAEAERLLPSEVLDRLSGQAGLPVCGGVFKDWLVELW